jgi:uncharacterized protein (DUF2147 family)
LSALLVAQAAGAGLAGYWTNERRSVVVLISDCVDDAMCGTVTSASERAKADAQRGGTQQLVGTQLMRGFVATGASRWKGHLFVPDLNKTSKAEIELLDESRLRVRGCAVGRLLCRSQTWSRVPNGPDATPELRQ